MHNTLRVEQYASAAELPHGFLLSPERRAFAGVPRAHRRARACSGRPHRRSSTSAPTKRRRSGLGQTQAYVAQRGRSHAYADHIVAMNRLIAPSGARLMLWDDGIESDPGIMKLIPQRRRRRQLALRRTSRRSSRYIQTIARGGFEQMIAPGASNWNEIFPASTTALANERRFISEGKAARVLGLFQTVGTTTARRSMRRRGIR